MTLEEALQQAGVDLEKTLHRFCGNAALLERFVKKFPLDPTFRELMSAADRQDHSTMEKSAHTLKGTTSNLGFDALSDRCADLVNQLRAGVTEWERLSPCVNAITEQYEAVTSWVSKID